MAEKKRSAGETFILVVLIFATAGVAFYFINLRSERLAHNERVIKSGEFIDKLHDAIEGARASGMVPTVDWVRSWTGANGAGVPFEIRDLGAAGFDVITRGGDNKIGTRDDAWISWRPEQNALSLFEGTPYSLR